MQVNKEWISISDMMTGLMMIFLFIAVLFMNEVQKKNKAIQKEKDEIQKQNSIIQNILETYQALDPKLNSDLNNEFKNDLKKWDAEILKDNTIRFNAPDVLFDFGEHRIKPRFKKILDDFFPRYLEILTSDDYINEIQEIRIEGHTSSVWSDATREQSYIENMRLSQNRAREVLAHVYEIIKSKDKKRWMEGHLRGNGLSFSKLIKHSGKEDMRASQRVEFRVLTKAEDKLYEIIDELKKPKS